jgi:glucose/arabinose dehydrogenase
MRALRIAVCILGLFAGDLSATLAAGQIQISQMASGLKQPWAIGFLPDGGWLVTLRGGALRHYQKNGRFNRVKDVPHFANEGKEGSVSQAIPATRTNSFCASP